VQQAQNAFRENSMFRENKQHLQGQLYSTVSELPPAQRQMLESSWAGTFRREVFARLDESALSILYATAASRPNVPVNVLLGLEILKAGFGWTDEEMYQAFLFNLQVRYALGYEQLGEGYFAMRTVYELRRRLSKWMRETGENLVEAAFVQITDAQLQTLKLKSETLRMDSTLVASDICKFTRLQLLVEILQRVQRMLSQTDQERYAEMLAPYLSCKASRYVYRLKHSEADVRLAAIGPVMLHLVSELAEAYATERVYGLLVRVFDEHFVLCGAEPSLKPYKEVGARSLQSPDDPQATLRHKHGQNHLGYVANVTETCDPDNPMQLIVKVQTQPNATDDAQMLVAALPELIERTEVKTLYTDGGYNSPSVDPLLHEAQIEHIQTALRGDRPDPACVSLVDFVVETDDEGLPLSLTCPQGQRMRVEPGKAPSRYIARPDPQRCAACPLLPRCRARPKPTAKTPTIYFDHRHLLLTQKRQAMATASPWQGNPRAAVEATIRSLKQPFRHGKLLVRGCFRIACLLLGSALMVNTLRIHAYVSTKPHKSRAKSAFADLFFAFLAHIACLGRCYLISLMDSIPVPTLRFPSSTLPTFSHCCRYPSVSSTFLQ
jgi:hypothetical protein